MLADFQTAVDSLVRDRDSVVTTDERDAAITTAAAQYSIDAPRELVVDQAAAAAGSVLGMPAGWTDHSKLIAAEYPIGQLPTSLLQLSDVTVYTSPTGQELHLPVALEAGEQIRITYTADHLLDDADDTIPVRHRNAVASLAAAILCGQLASYYSGESESTIGADTVDRKSKSDKWRARARDLAAVYDSAVGTAPSDRTKGASAVVQLQRPTTLGYRKLFHPPRNWPVV